MCTISTPCFARAKRHQQHALTCSLVGSLVIKHGWQPCITAWSINLKETRMHRAAKLTFFPFDLKFEIALGFHPHSVKFVWLFLSIKMIKKIMPDWDIKVILVIFTFKIISYHIILYLK